LKRLVEKFSANVKPAKISLRKIEKLSPTTFVEIPSASVAQGFNLVPLSCLLEVESSGHAKIRAQLNNATALDLATVLREFVRQ
jgi:hypothetical protein